MRHLLYVGKPQYWSPNSTIPCHPERSEADLGILQIRYLPIISELYEFVTGLFGESEKFTFINGLSFLVTIPAVVIMEIAGLGSPEERNSIGMDSPGFASKLVSIARGNSSQPQQNIQQLSSKRGVLQSSSAIALEARPVSLAVAPPPPPPDQPPGQKSPFEQSQLQTVSGGPDNPGKLPGFPDLPDLTDINDDITTIEGLKEFTQIGGLIASLIGLCINVKNMVDIENDAPVDPGIDKLLVAGRFVKGVFGFPVSHISMPRCPLCFPRE